MAWNPSPEVAIARDVAAKFKADRVVILYTLPDGRFGYASYGQTKELCADARKLGDKLFERAESHFAGDD
jgi:hypothetical protein